MKINELAKINPKTKLEDNSFINYIDTSSVIDGALLGIQYLDKDYPSRAQRVVEKFDILISSVRPNLKHNYFVKVDKENLIASTGFIQIRCKTNAVIPQYLYYFLSSEKRVNHYTMIADSSQTTFPSFNKDVIENLEIDLPNLETQQHIVDTIGSVDDLIEKMEEKLNKIKEYGGLIFNKTIDCNLIDLLKIAKFEKGKEIGSANYLDKQKTNSVPYIRVGNLLNGEYDTYVVNSDCPQCDYEDILIAFDGAPGRNIIGLKGCYSSGVQKVVCDKENKGYIYFYINSELCQNTIKVHSQGTTILHASKSIKELKIPIISSDNKNLLNSLFNEMVSLIKQKKKLKKEKDLLLKKYFG